MTVWLGWLGCVFVMQQRGYGVAGCCSALTPANFFLLPPKNSYPNSHHPVPLPRPPKKLHTHTHHTQEPPADSQPARRRGLLCRRHQPACRRTPEDRDCQGRHRRPASHPKRPQRVSSGAEPNINGSSNSSGGGRGGGGRGVMWVGHTQSHTHVQPLPPPSTPPPPPQGCDAVCC